MMKRLIRDSAPVHASVLSLQLCINSRTFVGYKFKIGQVGMVGMAGIMTKWKGMLNLSLETDRCIWKMASVWRT